MDRTLIQQYATGLVRGLLEQARAVSRLEHRVLKGRLRELFVANILDNYLTAQYGIGSGIIINQRGDQSNETDVIIYDKRILPPFIGEERIGVFPLEAVVATIEVKSRLRKQDLLMAEKAAKRLRKEVADRSGTIYRDEKKQPQPPMCSVIGFFGRGANALRLEKGGNERLAANIRHLWAVCLVGSYSWLSLRPPQWSRQPANDYAEETKRYIAVVLDNVRTQSEKNYRLFCERHRDWLGAYTRDNPAVRRCFETAESPLPGTSGL